MVKQLELKFQYITTKDMIILYLIWFFLQGFNQMIQEQLFFEGSIFLTQVIHYLFFLFLRLVFIPIVLYFILYRYTLPVEKFGLTTKKFSNRVKLGLKISYPIALLIFIFVHLPLVHTDANLKPMIIATNPENIALSLVFFILLVFMTLIPAFSEELLFRGLTFNFLEERFGAKAALILNALLYGLFYLRFDLSFIGLRVVLGFFSTYLFWRTKNLIPSTILQACFHSAMILYVFGWGWW